MTVGPIRPLSLSGSKTDYSVSSSFHLHSFIFLAFFRSLSRSSHAPIRLACRMTCSLLYTLPWSLFHLRDKTAGTPPLKGRQFRSGSWSQKSQFMVYQFKSSNAAVDGPGQRKATLLIGSENRQHMEKTYPLVGVSSNGHASKSPISYREGARGPKPVTSHTHRILGSSLDQNLKGSFGTHQSSLSVCLFPVGVGSQLVGWVCWERTQ